MGLFDKKYCDICGEKIGLLGNRKLADGNLCRNCAKKLSPFMTDRRESTIDEIRQHLAYREENKKKLPDFHPTKTIGNGTKVYIDEPDRTFIVTSERNWEDSNPDVISFSQVLRCDTEVQEHRSEETYNDKDGNNRSYSPPRYNYRYEFRVKIEVNSPYFSEIEFELSGFMRPSSRYSDAYNECEMEGRELSAILMQRNTAQMGNMGQNPYMNQGQQMAQPAGWTCPFCGTVNTGNFCTGCGQKKP